ncbi:MAG: putative DNA binding domain-containing protein [bacterium]|nr:putative DNA binding domain-containing protein [bacterium]
MDPPTPEEEVERVLTSLVSGSYTPDELESMAIDLKEEAGRRHNGNIRPGSPNNERVALQLAEEAVCMANTEGGGALIVGVDNQTGDIIGADTDPDWLRTRIYQLTDGRLTVNLRVAELRGRRLLVVIVPQAVEPVPFKGKYSHRQGRHCVPVTNTELLQGIFSGVAADPSYQRSSTPLNDVSPRTQAILRDLVARVDPGKAVIPLLDLLVRLGLVFEDSDYLNEAGRILLATRNRPSLDYTHRDVPGGPSSIRIHDSGRSLLEEIDLIEASANSNNPVTEILTGFGVHRVHTIPQRSLREAILNGVCHRDWTNTGPTMVEHVGYELRVTSPGGFVRGITTHNIITHPSAPRYRTLMNAVRQLGLVEQEGVGVDRMVADLIRIGCDPPLIELTDDPSVRVVLSGGQPDEDRCRFFEELRPRRASDDVDAALLVWRASQPGTPFLTGTSCTTLLQRTRSDAENAIRRVAAYQLAGRTDLLVAIPTPDGTPPAWRLSGAARDALRVLPPREPSVPALAWLRERGRISSTEYRALAGVSQVTASTHLKALAEAGELKPSRPSGRGRGFHYLVPGNTSSN